MVPSFLPCIQHLVGSHPIKSKERFSLFVYFIYLTSLINEFLINCLSLFFLQVFSPTPSSSIFFIGAKVWKKIEAETTKKKNKMHLSFFALSSSILATNTVAYAAAAAAAAADLQNGRHVLASMPKNYGLAIERRQDIECSSVEPGPQLCERSCGPSYTACVVYNSCYSPSLGQTCCENSGKYHSSPSRCPFYFSRDTCPCGKYSKFSWTDFLKI